MTSILLKGDFQRQRRFILAFISLSVILLTFHTLGGPSKPTAFVGCAGYTDVTASHSGLKKGSHSGGTGTKNPIDSKGTGDFVTIPGKPEGEGVPGSRATWLRGKDLTRDWRDKETKLLRGIPGFFMFENLYLFRGVLFAITSDKASFPPPSDILSGAREGDGHPPAKADRWNVLSPGEAESLLGTRGAGLLNGVSFLFNDGPGHIGFLSHYFHFVAEAFAGGWRVLASSPLNLLRDDALDTPFPSRFILPRGTDWRDHAGLNAWFINTIFPATSYEDSVQWEDWAKSDTLYVLEEVVIIDRWTAHRKEGSEAQAWNKMTADAFATPAPKNWFEPLRRTLMQRLGIEENAGKTTVVTYIDRQATGRRLVEEDHTALVDALLELGEEKDIKVNLVQMEHLSKTQQLDISTRTDILIGVHGNGLTHQLWMKPGSKVLEFFDSGAFLRDYQLLAESMQHDHYVIWNDTIHDTWRELKQPAYTSNFDRVHVHAPFIVELLSRWV